MFCCVRSVLPSLLGPPSMGSEYFDVLGVEIERNAPQLYVTRSVQLIYRNGQSFGTFGGFRALLSIRNAGVLQNGGGPVDVVHRSDRYWAAVRFSPVCSRREAPRLARLPWLREVCRGTDE